jgi:uracil permease
MANQDILRPQDKPSLARWIPLSFQHVFAMFGATILVPILTGLEPSAALFTAGTGTLIFILCTGAKVPAFLGSSFAFIPALIAIGQSGQYGIPYALGGALAAGLFYCLISLIIRFTGTKWLDTALPPVVIGSVIIVIGLCLAPVAMSMAMNEQVPSMDNVINSLAEVNNAIEANALPDKLNEATGELIMNLNGFINNYNLVYLSIAAFTLAITVTASILLKGFFSTIPILIGLTAGYFFTLIMGLFFPAYAIINFQAVKDASWFGVPVFHAPQFSLVPILTFIIVSLATICEHLGDVLVISKIAGQDFYKNPGLHRTLLGDGLATAWASLFGGPPNTTYGENVGVMAITRVYSVWVIGGAAVFAILLSFFTKVGAIIQTIPSPVLGGICMLLFGIIASSGLRTIVESGVDYKDKRNLTITSVILVIGIGGGQLAFNITQDLHFVLSGVALATIVGILLNLLIPKTQKSEKTEA